MGFFMPIANIVNLIIENWFISLAVLAVFASLCLGVFKGLKHGIRALAVLLVLALIGLGAYLIYAFISRDLDGFIKFGIAWFPTIIFLIAILISTLTGVRRGLRKSLILFLHAILMAGICIGLFFYCVTSTTFDKLLLNVINVFMGEEGLQKSLSVSVECETLREVLLEFFNGYAVGWGEIGILLGSTSAYVLTLVNMAYHIVFAIVFFIIYKLLLFIMYLIYLIFYPERRYKKKRNLRFAMSKADSSYNKRPVAGGCVGLVRGIISGVIALSFLGGVFFIATGGVRASKLPEEFSLGEDYDSYISIYRSIEDYGDQGIFKILNAIRDPEDTPYYLFAADIVFSGGLDDELHDVRGNVKLREELAAYTGFAKNTLALLMKHDTDGEIAAILRGTSSADTMDTMLNVFTKPEFRVEFENLIDNFDAQTYIINFALSLADAVIANIDDVSFMSSVSAENKELLQVLFRRGYLSNTIPDERERKQTLEGELTEEIPPYITINHLITKKDAQIILEVVLSILAGEIEVSDPATIARVLVPNIEELSILSTKRSKEMDPVFGRLYCYFDNKYLTDEGEDGIRYSEVKNESVYWTKEIRALLGVADGIITMYDKVQSSEGENIFTTITSLFDENTEGYEENVRVYEELTEVVSDSALISKVLSSNKVHNFLNEQLKSVSENVYFPQRLSYENKYDSTGNLISHGEAYHILRGLRLLADKDNKEIIDSLLESSTSFEDLIKKLAATITKDDPHASGNSLASYMTESILLRSLLSSVIIDRAGDMLIIPTLSLETDNGQAVNLINKLELREIFDALPELVDLILPLASEEEITGDHVTNILKNETFNSLLDNGNKIVEGTIANALIDVLKDGDKIIISKKLESYEGWITVNTPGELRMFLKAIDILAIDVGGLMNGEGLNGTEIFDTVKSLDADSITQLFESSVFHYSASNMLDSGDFGFEGFQIIVPASSCTDLEEGEKIKRVIKKEELASVFLELKDFGFSSDMKNEDIIRKLVEKRQILDDSYIISATVVHFIIGNDDIRSALGISQLPSFNEAGQVEVLKGNYTTNVWRAELPKLIGAIDEIFGISNLSGGDTFEFNGETIAEKTNSLVMSLNDSSVTQLSGTRLSVCYSSDIVKNKITTELDKAFNGSDQNDESLIEISVRDSFKINYNSVKAYSEIEISALVDALHALGIGDVDNISTDNFNTLDKYKANIDKISASGLIRGIITKRIDDSLNENLIDATVKSQIKVNNAYSAEEISELVIALDELGMTDFNSLDGYKFSENMLKLKSPSSNEPDKTKLNIIYRSDLVVGVITKSVKDTFEGNEALVYHKGAERSASLPLLKEQEIESLISLLNTDDLNSFKVGSISLSSVRAQLEADNSGNPRSYLIAANFADTLINNTALYVPKNVYVNDIITSSEALNFIDALDALQSSSGSLDGWNVDGDMKVPDNREAILNSAIMRATFSHSVFMQNTDIAFLGSNLEQLDRVTVNRAIQSKGAVTISREQLETMFDIIGVGSDGLGIPSFSGIDSIRMYRDNIDLFYKFDVTRYTMSKIILRDVGGSMGTPQNNWYKFNANGTINERPESLDILPWETLAFIVSVG